MDKNSVVSCPLLNTSLNDKLVQNYIKTKCLEGNNQAPYTDNMCANLYCECAAD